MPTRCNPELEKKYNWYVQKIIYNESAQGLNTVVKAIIEYIAATEKIAYEDRPDYIEVDEYNGITHIDYNNGMTTIDVEQVSEDAFLVKCTEVYEGDEEKYNYKMFNYLEEYMLQIASNRCPVCGEEIAGKGKFCSNCGAIL